jgi:hypothetical protein
MGNSRVLKFRAWDKVNLLMRLADGEDNGPSSDTEWIGMTELAHRYEKKGWILMQFTGLLDRNGKEIYEGDVIEFLDGIDKVLFDSDRAMFRGRNTVLTSSTKYDVKVIGNIYQDSELLNV